MSDEYDEKCKTSHKKKYGKNMVQYISNKMQQVNKKCNMAKFNTNKMQKRWGWHLVGQGGCFKSKGHTWKHIYLAEISLSWLTKASWRSWIALSLSANTITTSLSAS